MDGLNYQQEMLWEWLYNFVQSYMPQHYTFFILENCNDKKQKKALVLYLNVISSDLNCFFSFFFLTIIANLGSEW